MKKINFLGRFMAVIMLYTAMMTVSGCINAKKINITSFKISSISPEGFRAVRGAAALGIDNQTNGFRIFDIEGVIRRNNKELGNFAMDPLTIAAHKTAQYDINGRLALSDNISAFELLSLIPQFKASEYTVDLYFKVKPQGGATHKQQYKDIPAERILKMLK